jgi:hypothetical protein
MIKFWTFFLVMMSLAHGQVPSSPKLPTEDLHIPGTLPPQHSEVEAVVESAEELAMKAATEAGGSLARRPVGSVMLGYQLLSSWMPSKKTIAYTHHLRPQMWLEAEYGWGSLGVPAWIIDVAQVRERRYSLLMRHFTGRSFHFIYGASFNRVDATVGSRYLQNAGAGSQDVFNVQGYGVSLGLGNRWHWQNGITLGVDWMRTHVPLLNRKADSAILENIQAGERSQMRDTISLLKNIPTFVLLGINLGYTF